MQYDNSQSQRPLGFELSQALDWKLSRQLNGLVFGRLIVQAI